MKDQGPRFWDTCYTTEITACVTFEAGFDGQFHGRWREDLFTGSEPFRITAWGMQFPGKAGLDFLVGDDAWNFGGPLDFGWTDFSFVMFTNEWEFAVGGPNYEGLMWQGDWTGHRAPTLAGTRFAWRGETEDHRLVFDCIQRGPGSTKCVSVSPALHSTDFGLTVASDFSTTTAPEPSTLLLVLTGLALFKIARRVMA